MSKPKIFIATPTVGNVLVEYAHSLVATVQQLHRQGVETEYATFDGSTAIADKRDWLAHRFLKSDATHLLFVDADMAFDQALASTLLGFGKDVIGAICTTRAINLAAMARQPPRATRTRWRWRTSSTISPTRIGRSA